MLTARFGCSGWATTPHHILHTRVGAASEGGLGLELIAVKCLPQLSPGLAQALWLAADHGAMLCLLRGHDALEVLGQLKHGNGPATLTRLQVRGEQREAHTRTHAQRELSLIHI